MQGKKLTIVNFGSRFADLVENCGLSQKDLAAQLGISEGSIVNYKRDRIPKAEELLAICSHFNISVEQLLTGTGHQQSQRVAPPSESGTIKAAKTEAERLARLLGEAEQSLSKLRSFLG